MKIIDWHAFQGCQKLSAVNLNEGLDCIHGYSFNSSTITQIEIPESVRYIESFAFH